MKRTLLAVEYSEEEKKISMVAKAISHPVRIQILKLLANQTCCFTGELTEMIPMAQSTISQHLKALLDANLIQGEINPPKVRYCIDRDNWLKAYTMFGTFFAPDQLFGCDCLIDVVAQREAIS